MSLAAMEPCKLIEMLMGIRLLEPRWRANSKRDGYSPTSNVIVGKDFLGERLTDFVGERRSH
jgi:hypothetical protein